MEICLVLTNMNRKLFPTTQARGHAVVPKFDKLDTWCSSSLKH
jgi:hypothetical protein